MFAGPFGITSAVRRPSGGLRPYWYRSIWRPWARRYLHCDMIHCGQVDQSVYFYSLRTEGEAPPNQDFASFHTQCSNQGCLGHAGISLRYLSCHHVVFCYTLH